MRLDDYVAEFERDEDAEIRRLAEQKSYRILDHLEGFEDRFENAKQGDALFGSVSPSVFVGRTGYPDVSVGIMSPVGEEEADDRDPSDFATDSGWYRQGLDIESVLQYRTGLLNSRKYGNVERPASSRFVDVQREVAMASDPVDVEVALKDDPEVDVSLDRVRTPTGPNARAASADLAENPSVPRAVEKAYGDDDWKARGAVSYLYEKGLDVYDIKRVFSVGALGRGDHRKLVPTRWSITAIDDMVGQHVHEDVTSRQQIGQTEVHYNEYVGNRYWVILTPGNWEFELVEMKAPGSVWNPDPGGDYYLGSAHEGFEGRSQYVDETAGAYYASRLGVLEHLRDRGRQAKALVLRVADEEYWAPVGVWQIRESVRNAFDDDPGVAETFDDAVTGVLPHLPVDRDALRRKSTMVTGRQSDLSRFG